MQKVFDLILRCAEVDSTVLILGETGVGKELAAKAIHKQSARKEKPFVEVNCNAIPETLLESELFGHVKGAFTGALSERLGLFREAQGGTLFLDEVGDLSGALQGKLLRALQEREIRPVGGGRTYPVDLRVIAATNKDLKTLVDKGSFREDLYYRVAVIPLSLPPLRNRREDILELSKHFIEKYGKETGKASVKLDRHTQQILLEYSWPGNVRELENCVEHAIAMTRGPYIIPNDLPVQIALTSHHERRDSKVPEAEATESVTTGMPASADTTLATPAMSMREAERRAILKALRLHNGNRTLAAKELGISRATVWRKMKKYSIPAPILG